MANRNLICVDCGDTIWLSQKQWKKLLEGQTPHKLKRNFRCKKCKKLERDNIIEYQLQYGKPIKKLRTQLKNAHWEYLTHKNLNKLNEQFNIIFKDNKIDNKQYISHHDPDRNMIVVTKILIKGVPFIDHIAVSIYSPRGKSN